MPATVYSYENVLKIGFTYVIFHMNNWIIVH